jgi:hypothetical protein
LHDAGEELPSTESSDEVRAAALNALDAISLAETLLAEFEEKQRKKLAEQEEQALSEAGSKTSCS